MAVYNIGGNRIDFDGTAMDTRVGALEKSVDYDINVRSVNHRGYSAIAPENTLPAYILSKKMGFKYAETDVCFTKDGVPVLLHDGTIDRTSNGSGNINNLTFEQVRQYDFGSWKSAEYAGTKIPSFEEFIVLCKRIMLHPYIEFKGGDTYTEAQIRSIVDMVRDAGMKGKVTYISFGSQFLTYVKNYDPDARLGFLKSTPVASDLSVVQALKTTTNEVFYDVGYYNDGITQAICNTYAAAGFPIEAWTVDSADVLLGLNKYVSGITSDNLIAGKVLYEAEMG